MKKRCVILILDMVAGHWDEAHPAVPSTGLRPPNVKDYAAAGLLPEFARGMREGVFVPAWNRGICNTPHGQKYLASGTYRTRSVPGLDPYWRMEEGLEARTILSACKRTFPDGLVGGFGSDAWMQTGWWKAADCTLSFGSYFSDFLTSQRCFAWMSANPQWKMTLLYLSQFDQTGRCPISGPDHSYTKDKHHSLLHLDRLLWQVRAFLEESGWWQETVLFIGSDHGCHVGCDVAVQEGRQRGVAEAELVNYCSDHQAPYDCLAWDFARNAASARRSDCARRTLFMATGGGLDPALHGRSVEGEIIDFPATIASVMGIDFPCEGRALF